MASMAVQLFIIYQIFSFLFLICRQRWRYSPLRGRGHSNGCYCGVWCLWWPAKKHKKQKVHKIEQCFTILYTLL